MNHPEIFSGSYSASDVQFLLKPIDVESTPIDVKEVLIQSGQRHYSELLTHETLPSRDYLDLFHQALALNRKRMAGHVLQLAARIRAARPHGMALVSLARAGTPIGVLLKHTLKRHFGIDAAHYSISIIRDIGIDRNALRYILHRHGPEELTFIDGWTGKGVIARQLALSLEDFAASDGVEIPADLFVLADLSGDATVTASTEDYLIPSSILNSIVSGLISRSVFSRNPNQAADFHGCYFYHEFRPYDLSNRFISEMLDSIEQSQSGGRSAFDHPSRIDSGQLKRQSQQFLDWIGQRYGIINPNYIKPGIGEATRVLLRRKSDRLLLREKHSDDTRHLYWLASAKHVPIEIVDSLPYRAAALIQEIKVPT
ncbi:MAG: cysteine protease StiP family protein [Gammaproteobacteria bacterium]